MKSSKGKGNVFELSAASFSSAIIILLQRYGGDSKDIAIILTPLLITLFIIIIMYFAELVEFKTTNELAVERRINKQRDIIKKGLRDRGLSEEDKEKLQSRLKDTYNAEINMHDAKIEAHNGKKNK